VVGDIASGPDGAPGDGSPEPPEVSLQPSPDPSGTAGVADPAPGRDDGAPAGRADDGPSSTAPDDPEGGPAAPPADLSAGQPVAVDEQDGAAQPPHEPLDVPAVAPVRETPVAVDAPVAQPAPADVRPVGDDARTDDPAPAPPGSAPVDELPVDAEGPAAVEPAGEAPATWQPAEPVHPPSPVADQEPGPALPSWSVPPEVVGPGPGPGPAWSPEPARWEFPEWSTPPQPAAEVPAWPAPPAAAPARPDTPAPAPAAPAPEPPPVPVDSRRTPVPRPTRASRRAAASRAPVGEPGRRAGGRGRRGRVILAALVALVVLAVAAVGAVTFLGDRHDPTTAEQLPGAVLPSLGEPAPVLAALSADAPVPDRAVLAGILTPLLRAPALGTGLSAQVVDVATGDVLYDQAAEDPSTPASTAKLLTATAALTVLDPASTLRTTVVAGATPGEVVLVGGGDPTLSTTVPSRAYPGAATVADLAAQVQQKLAGTPVTRVVVDNSLFTGPLTAPGWQPDDAPSTYAAPVTATAVDGARVDPNGTQRSGSPGTDAGRALAAALGAPGTEVTVGTAPAGAATLATVHSASVERLVEQALTASDNLLAESLARHVALARGLPASFSGAAQAVSAAIAAAGLDTTGLSMVDASGLSQQDRLPARLLVDVVRAASDGAVPAAAGLLSGLPVAGYDGTLAERAAGGAGVPGAVRAKTGTLRSVNDLAGTVLTADGRLLAFAVLADGAAGSVGTTETALDVVAAALAGCGCR
jgi:D-alanyl-D-alanine carboxypeptidase